MNIQQRITASKHSAEYQHLTADEKGKQFAPLLEQVINQSFADSYTAACAVGIIQAIHRHPDPQRAHAVLQDIMHRISSGEDLKTIEAMYAVDLSIMRGEA